MDNPWGSLNVDLSYNKINSLPESLFRAYCTHDSRVKINLNINPIQCKYSAIEWVYGEREASEQNVNCIDYNNRITYK